MDDAEAPGRAEVMARTHPTDWLPWRRREPASALGRVLRGFVLALLCTVWIGASRAEGPAGTGASPVLSGCEVDYPPYCIVTYDGKADGFSVELLRAAMEAVGGCTKAFAEPPRRVARRGWVRAGNS